MILYTDSITQVDYAPANDVMTVTLQIVRGYDANEVRKAFITVIGMISQYNVTRLLLDLTNSTTDLHEEEYKKNITLFTAGLLQTPLRKIARITTPNPIREKKVASIYEEVSKKLKTQFVLRHFSTNTEALAWLTA